MWKSRFAIQKAFELTKAWLGLGGNIGDVKSALSAALRLIDEDVATQVDIVSSLYKTPPWGVVDQPWFHNCCAQISTELTPEELLELCQGVERAGNRQRKERWGPRTIDVDILMIDGVSQTEQRLTIPHPRMGERAFVLIPLAQIAPYLMLKGSTIQELAQSANPEGMELLKLRSDWWQ